MDRQLLLAAVDGTERLAVLEDGELVELLVDAEASGSLVGNIYIGRVDNVVAGMDAAFVDIGAGQNALLPLSDADPAQLPLRGGAAVLVQVLKQPGQGKGPRLTQRIALPGRAAVLTPLDPRVSISKKIADPAERQRLRGLCDALRPDGAGLVVRTAAEGADAPALAGDIAQLGDLWREIVRVAPNRRPPALLHGAPGLAARAVRDFLGTGASELVVEGEALCREAAAHAAPEQLPRIRLHASDVPLMALHRVQAQLDAAMERRVWLPSGGELVFDYTEAMTVVDVNSGKFVGKASLEDTLLRTNLEAAAALCRQLRLRDVGGIVVVDFIDMAVDAHRRQLLAALEEELKKDRMKATLHGMTALGLVEITRKKDRSGMLGARAVCPTCKGAGRIERKKEPK